MPDPYRNFKFEVEIEGFTRAGFSKVSGLTDSTEVIDYREGGDNESPRKLSGQTSFGDVTLERGMSIDSDFIEWRKLVYNADQSEGAQGPDDEYRKTVVIYLKSKSGNRVKKWTLSRAWPREKGSPDLDAMGNDPAIESLIIVNEGQKEETL